MKIFLPWSLVRSAPRCTSSPLSMLDEDYLYFYYYDNVTENDTSNHVCLHPGLRGSHIFLPVTYFLIFFSGFWGNVFVIAVVWSKGKRAGRLVDTFVVNLALADLVFVLTLPLWAISAGQNNHWHFGAASDVLCKLSSYIISVNRFSNVFFLTCMSVDRYLATVRMMDLRHLRSSRCVRITCAALWVVSLILGIPFLVYRYLAPFEGGQACQADDSSMLFLGMNLATEFLTFVLPALIILLCYGAILKHLNRHRVAAGNARAEARRRHSVKMVLCVMAAFVVSWLPFNTFKSVRILSRLSDFSLSCETTAWLSHGFVVSCCLAFFNSCMNPAIYFFLDHHFRLWARLLFRGCIRKTKAPPSFNALLSVTSTSWF
uniref:G protein-coupled receptor 25 n=1 Tax=Fundulus heteroclitus TaxID=8078 RepID=A0A3Q2QD03_FUNHE